MTHIKQRNLVTKLKKQSVRTYFYERCVGGPKSTDFYPTIKPFLSDNFIQKPRYIITLCSPGELHRDPCGLHNSFDQGKYQIE
jgi:hypothetical protein